jgi:hypothetical protein
VYCSLLFISSKSANYIDNKEKNIDKKNVDNDILGRINHSYDA